MKCLAIASVVLLCQLQTGVARQNVNTANSTSQDPIAYEVYNATLNRSCPAESRRNLDWESWGCDIQGANPLLIADHTVIPGRCEKAVTSGDRRVVAAFKDWLEQNKSPKLLTRQIAIPGPYELLSAEQIGSFFDPQRRSAQGPLTPQQRWDEFNQAHPTSKGWVEFSAVGFNKDKTVAAVYVAHHCGPRCGRGFVQVLQKEGGTWKPIRSAVTGCGWIS